MLQIKINIISSSANQNEEFEKANIILHGGTKFTTNNALFSSQSKRNLLSFKYIHYIAMVIILGRIERMR